MRTSLVAVVGIALCVAQGAATADALDVSGIALRTPAAGVQALLLKANPAYKIEELKLTTGRTAGYKAVAPVSPAIGTIDNMVVLLNEAGKVWTVSREQTFAKGGRIDWKALQAAWNQKYGAPTNNLVLGAGVAGQRWELDRNGKTHRNPKAAGPCPVGYMDHDWNSIPGTRLKVLSRFAPTCGTLIISASEMDENMAKTLTTTIIDTGGKFDEIQANENAKEAEKQRLLKKEKEAGTKINL